MRFRKRGKLSPRYVGPFEILDIIGQVAYQVALPPALSNVHNVFHISLLKKYMADPSHALSYAPSQLKEDLSYEEVLTHILDYKEHILRNHSISYVKVLWRNHSVQEASLECEEDMRARYPQLF
ncbi:uncharacterized protein LOC122070552 [Macadamia integrifolia]|uniref:uncharacterized protein LOC122070552 n=1 Tax=Macadamia integrifolia TaxID=60698 RepID=UPI001C4F665B|nr:uncharacterized protein LOC122070552 [Macadamia integrifolia]